MLQNNHASQLRMGSATGEGNSVGPFSHPLLTSFVPDGGKATGSGVPSLPLGSRTVADASSRQATRQPLPSISSAGPSWLPPKPPARTDREVDEAELRLLGSPLPPSGHRRHCSLAPQTPVCLCARATVGTGGMWATCIPCINVHMEGLPFFCSQP